MASTRDEFTKRAQAKLNELEKAEAQLAAQEEGVKRTRQDLQQRISVLRQSIFTYKELMGPQITERKPSGTIVSLSLELMEKAGGSLRVSEIAHALVKMGKLQGKGHANYASVYGTLNRDPRFEKAGVGAFRIKHGSTGDGHVESREDQAAAAPR